MAISRRRFLTTAGIAGATVAWGGRALAWPVQTPAPAAWGADEILRRIVPPAFPARDFDITRFGAKGDGVADATGAMRDAIAACRAAGGGRVVVPAGRFLTGPIRLRGGVNLHLLDGATLAFTRDPAAYLPPVLTRYEGTELMNYSPFIYALDETNVGISGSGTLDGQADATHWWNWPRLHAADRTAILAMSEARTPVAARVFGGGHYLRPNFIQPYRCTNVLIEGVTIVNSPMWEIHPVLSTNVTIRGVTVISHGPNNDGCDPESCRDVLIDRCTFDTGDDCIAIKSGRNADGRRVNVPAENHVIRECVMKDGHGGVTIGSEISGGARNIFIETCRMDSPRLERALRFKNNAMRGGLIEHVYMRDVTVGEVADAVVSADFTYEEGDKGPFSPVLRDVEVRQVTSRKSKYALYLRGYPAATIADIRLVDCVLDGVANPDVLENVGRVAFTRTKVNGIERR